MQKFEFYGNGQQYISKELYSYLSRKQDSLKPHENKLTCKMGLQKGKNRHLLEATMSLLSQMNVSKIFWSDVVLTAAFLINQLPTRVLKGKSPSQVLCLSATLLFIPRKAFGSVCFFHIPKHQRDKLDAKAINCMFVGNLTTLKGCKYYLFAIKNGKQFVSVDVSFFSEHSFLFIRI